MKILRFTIIILLFLSLLSLCFLYVLYHKVADFDTWVERIAVIFPGVLIALGLIVWSLSSEKQRFAKVISGILFGVVIDIYTFHRYINNVIALVDKAEKKTENFFYILSGVFVIIISILALISTFRKSKIS